MTSRPQGCMCNLPIKKDVASFATKMSNLHYDAQFFYFMRAKLRYSTLEVCLGSAYFVETENFLLKQKTFC